MILHLCKGATEPMISCLRSYRWPLSSQWSPRPRGSWTEFIWIDHSYNFHQEFMTSSMTFVDPHLSSCMVHRGCYNTGGALMTGYDVLYRSDRSRDKFLRAGKDLRELMIDAPMHYWYAHCFRGPARILHRGCCVAWGLLQHMLCRSDVPILSRSLQ